MRASKPIMQAAAQVQIKSSLPFQQAWGHCLHLLPLFITPAHYTCSLHLLITPAHYTCSLHLLITPSNYTCSLHLLITPAHYTYSLHLLNAPAQCTCSIHLLNAPAQYTCSKQGRWSVYKAFRSMNVTHLSSSVPWHASPTGSPFNAACWRLWITAARSSCQRLPHLVRTRKQCTRWLGTKAAHALKCLFVFSV